MSAPVLREVSGPGALGGSWRRTRDLLFLIAATEFKRAYFGTVLGYLWTLARPLLLFGVMLAVFTQAFKLPAEVEHYEVLLLLNIVLFGLFQESTSTAVTSVVAHEGIVRKTQFPRLVIPLSVVLTALFNLGLNLIVVVVFLLAFGVDVRATWLLLPVLVLALTVFATAVSMIVSSLYPRFRDVAIIWSVSATALFYGTPVLYPLEVVDARMREIISLNPLAPIFELSHKWIVNSDAPSPVELTGGTGRLLIPIGIYAATCVLAVWVFRREAPRIAEEL